SAAGASRSKACISASIRWSRTRVLGSIAIFPILVVTRARRNSNQRNWLLIKHDLFGKPVPTFPDHAPEFLDFALVCTVNPPTFEKAFFSSHRLVLEARGQRPTALCALGRKGVWNDPHPEEDRRSVSKDEATAQPVTLRDARRRSSSYAGLLRVRQQVEHVRQSVGEAWWNSRSADAARRADRGRRRRSDARGAPRAARGRRRARRGALVHREGARAGDRRNRGQVGH